MYLSLHSAGEKLIIPWGHTAEPYHDNLNLVRLLERGRSGLGRSGWITIYIDYRAAMGDEGRNYTIGNVKEAFGSVKSLSLVLLSVIFS